MGKPKGYDPTKIKIYAGGMPIQDFGTDSMVKVARAVDMRSPTVGADGNLTVNKSANNTGTLEITIMNNSASNAILKGLALLDGGFPIAVVDMNFAGDLGSSTVHSWVQNIPDFERAEKVGECTWPIILGNVDVVFDALKDL